MNGRSLTDGEIRELFATIDANNDSYVSIEEWQYFFKIFIDFFQTNCDTDLDF